MKRVAQGLRRAWLVLQSYFDRPYRIECVLDCLPNTLRTRTLYVVHEDGDMEQAAMLCPCGCKKLLHLNLLPDERPRWQITRNTDGTFTLSPSVWRKKGCGSHFWFRRGRIQWVHPDPESF